jgi:outer membrane protein, multidrug efflux system
LIVRGLLGTTLAGLVAGCQLAPPYHPPQLILPDSYQGSGPFRKADLDAVLSPRGDWWTLFGDPQLNDLEERLGRANPNLQAAAERYTQARELAVEAQSHVYPRLDAAADLSDNKRSLNSLYRVDGGGPDQEASNDIGLGVSWEPDFWGAIRNGVQEQKRLAQASAADLAIARLSLQAELASDYVALRGLDAELEVLRQSIVSYRKAVQITRLRRREQIVSGLDVARALSELRSAEGQQTETRLQRDLLQHAIAVLIGVTPIDFSIAPVARLQLLSPRIPTGVPSQLLERRPDVASAEREMAAANAAIGVARAAFYPNITLAASGGFEDSGFNLLNLPNSLWSIGAGAMLPLFEGGLRRAELERSWAQYRQTRDDYRATVLSAFQDVEDGLSLTQRLATEEVQQREASDEAEHALWISTRLYKEGLDNFLSVSVAQVQALAARSVEIQVRMRQIQATVGLIRSLGGGWTVRALPSTSGASPK